MDNLAPLTTSSRNKIRLYPSAAGFTLIEILIVIMIITMVMALGLPAIERVTSQKLNSTTRKFMGLVRTIRNDSILLNSIHRLVIDMKEKTYWVEVQKSNQLIAEPTAFRPQKKNTKEKEPPPSNFDFASKYSSRPLPMPGGVVFESVLKEKEGLIQDATAYVHFFPNGFNEQAILHIAKDGSPGKGYSLLIRSTAGKAEVHRKYLTQFDVNP